MNKIAIVILSDAKGPSEEALGRVLNALILANELQNKEIPFHIIFQGTGTRWVNVLEDQTHLGHTLYQAVKPYVKGASMTCAAVFGANITTLPLLCELDVPGLGQVSNLAQYIADGYTLITF